MGWIVRPGIYISSFNKVSHAQLIWSGKQSIIVESKRWEKYVNKPIYWFDEQFIYGILILGHPKGPIPRERIGRLSGKTMISDEELSKKWGNVKEFWVWIPRIGKRFKKPIEHPKWSDVQTFKRQVALKEVDEESEIPLVQSMLKKNFFVVSGGTLYNLMLVPLGELNDEGVEECPFNSDVECPEHRQKMMVSLNKGKAMDIIIQEKKSKLFDELLRKLRS